VFVGIFETVLQSAKKAFAAGYGKHHAAEFSQETLPPLDRYAFASA
jgi:hypothetical protein